MFRAAQEDENQFRGVSFFFLLEYSARWQRQGSESWPLPPYRDIETKKDWAWMNLFDDGWAQNRHLSGHRRLFSSVPSQCSVLRLLSEVIITCSCPRFFCAASRPSHEQLSNRFLVPYFVPVNNDKFIVCSKPHHHETSPTLDLFLRLCIPCSRSVSGSPFLFCHDLLTHTTTPDSNLHALDARLTLQQELCSTQGLEFQQEAKR